MKLSKLSITFALVVSVHVAVLGFILLQPGCKSSPEPLVPDKTVTPNPELAKLQPPTSTEEKAPEFQQPTRPTWTDTEEAAAVNASVAAGEPKATAEAPAGAAAGSYTIERGDNLSKIAKKQGVSLKELMQANGLTSSSVLKIGQTLVVPASSGASAAVAPAAGEAAALPGTIESAPGEAGKRSTYVVQKGDSLSKIAARQHTSVATLQRLNNLKGTNIRLGQKLVVPGAAVSAPAVEKASASAPAAPAASVPASGSTYKVASGDTFGSIAKKHGVKLSALTAANPGVDARRLKVGQSIVLPGSASAPAPSVDAVAPTTATTAVPEAPIVPEAPVIPESAVVPTATTAVPEAPVTQVPASEL